MTPTELNTFLTTATDSRKPLKWGTMSAQEKDDFVASTRGTFSPELRQVLRKFWLKVPNAEALENANAELPAFTRTSPLTTVGGDDVVNIDLLTDMETYKGPMNMIRGWSAVQLDTDTDFPNAETV